MVTVPVPDVDVILFDLDNTLYPRDLGFWAEIDKRILGYVSQALDLPSDEAREVQKRYWRTYGTTIMGLMAEHQIDPEPYLTHVHDVDARLFLQPNPALAAVLANLPHRKAVFTNASSGHARNVLEALELLPYFDMLVGMGEVGYISKPNTESYRRCLSILGVAPQRCLFVEDTPANLPPAAELGMVTVLLGQPHQGEADYYLTAIEDIGHLFGLNGSHPPTA